MKHLNRIFFIVLICFLTNVNIIAQDSILVFPDAVGFGIYTPAGSGRHLDIVSTNIIKVTNLDDSGPGSLRDALVNQLSPKTIVFEVAGTIKLQSPIRIGGFTGNEAETKGSYITIAGQTAPEPGIIIKNAGIKIERNCHDILIQHLRFRTGDDALWTNIDTDWINESSNIYSYSSWSGCILGQVFWEGLKLTKNDITPSSPNINEWGNNDGIYFVNVGQNPNGGGIVFGCYKSSTPDAFSIVHSYSPTHTPPWYPAKYIVIDHCSMAYGTDIQITCGGRDMTVSNSIIAECLANPYHPKGPHSKGMLALGYSNGAEESGCMNLAVIQNLFMRQHNRMPMISYGAATVANNLVFDWTINGIGVDDHADSSFPVKISIVGNYTIETGQNTAIILQIGKPESKLFLGSDNFVGGNVASDPYNNYYIKQCHNWSNCEDVPFETRTDSACKASWPEGYTAMTATDARIYILDNVGAYPIFRDSADINFLYDVSNEINKDIGQTTKAVNSDCYGAGVPFDCCTGVGTGNCPDVIIQTISEITRPLVIPVNPNDDDNGDGHTNMEEWLFCYSCEVEGRDCPECNINVVNEKNMFIIYPNPTNGLLTIDWNFEDVYEISIENIIGQQLIVKSINSSTNSTSLNISNLSNDIYFLLIKLKDKIHVEKIIKN